MEKTKLEGMVYPTDAVASLERFSEKGAKFDLVFADPPFTKRTDLKNNLLSNPEQRHFARELLENKFLPKILKPGGFFVLDSYDHDRFEVPAPWNIFREKVYGQVRVRFLILQSA